MRRLRTGDSWAEYQLLRAEEVLAEARAFTVRRALRCNSHPRRRRVRIWLDPVLFIVGHRLRRSVPALPPASAHKVKGTGP
jgi:hypothetical protein